MLFFGFISISNDQCLFTRNSHLKFDSANCYLNVQKTLISTKNTRIHVKMNPREVIPQCNALFAGDLLKIANGNSFNVWSHKMVNLWSILVK